MLNNNGLTRRDGLKLIESLSYCDNLGDVHECIDTLCKALGFESMAGDFESGFTLPQEVLDVDA